MSRRTAAMEALVSACSGCGAEIRYHADNGYFTAMVWEDGTRPACVEEALAIQKAIRERTAQYPGAVCYCFDPFSTLVYMV